MIPIRMMVLWICTVLCTVLAAHVFAEDLPTLSIRYMTIEADEIVLVEPADPKAGVLPSRYRAISVLKGSDIQPGQEIVVRNEGLYKLKPPEWLRKSSAKKSPVQIMKALLFLKRPTKEAGEKGYRTVLSGIRALAENGEVLVPQQLMNPGPQVLLPKKGEDWDAMLAQVRCDLPSIAKIRKLGTIPDHERRNKAIFEWIGKHKKEFGGGYFAGQLKGWASLEQQLFDWLMESCIPEDCWRAIGLSTELDTGPKRSHPSFCSPQGRELLMAKVFDQKLPDSMRIKALRELGGGSTFWYSHRQTYPRTELVTQKEQEKIIGRVTQLLGHADSAWRNAAVHCLMSVSWPYDANFKHMTTKLAIPNLVALYGVERNAEVRKQIVDAIRRIEDDAFWKGLSGNPQGIVVFVRFCGIKQGVLEFRLDLEHTQAKLTEMPILRLEKLDSQGKLTKTQTIEPELRFPKNLFTGGWESWMNQPTVTIPSSKVGPGLWRVVAEGRVGKGGMTWRSEPVEVIIP